MALSVRVGCWAIGTRTYVSWLRWGCKILYSLQSFRGEAVCKALGTGGLRWSAFVEQYSSINGSLDESNVRKMSRSNVGLVEGLLY